MSRLPWVSAGASKNHHGQQCAICGDAVRDDIMGDGTAVRLEGSSIIVQFVQADDQILEAKRDSMKVRSLVQHDRVVLERKGKRAADQIGTIAVLHGKEAEAPAGAETKKPRQRGGAVSRRWSEVGVATVI